MAHLFDSLQVQEQSPGLDVTRGQRGDPSRSQQHQQQQQHVPRSFSQYTPSQPYPHPAFFSTTETETLSASPLAGVQPPVTYMASLIAQQLLQIGASMFGRRSDANCVLRVGTERYFVHVQMLASRSPTFRRIFDEMIAQEAWGGSHDADILSDILSEGGASGSQLDEGDELGSYNSDYGYDDSASMSMSGEDRGPDTDDDDESMRGSNNIDAASQIQQNQQQNRYQTRIASQGELASGNRAAFTYLSGPAVNANRLPQAPLSPPERRMEAMSIERLNVQIHQQLRVQGEDGRHDQEMRKRMTSRESPRLVSDEEEEEEDDDREGSEGAESDGEDARSIDSEGTDGGLPELSVTFADPEGSHFEELLYWLYTGNSNRWIQFFTPENYGSILQNILHLNIVTNAVLDICLVFEASTSPELGLRGMARAILCAPSLSSPSSPLSSIDVSAEVAAGMEPTDTGPTYLVRRH